MSADAASKVRCARNSANTCLQSHCVNDTFHNEARTTRTIPLTSESTLQLSG